ncbi:unnamed protein product [Oppiella nova]|uniref:Uncharacterized protein n=1 Tax=Oppiella nova TaxID=334625 RepID=A0A7R9R2K1_9ACAR|nr:unnamed protein product [Oppiella nova]CAG2183369.1 unnamed protein product [Oppiella nova]
MIVIPVLPVPPRPVSPMAAPLLPLPMAIRVVIISAIDRNINTIIWII